MDKPGTGDLSERERGGGKGEEKNNQRKKGSPASPLQQRTDKNHQAARNLLEEEGESLRRNSADLTAQRGWLVTPVTRRSSPGPAPHAARAHGEMGRRGGCLVSGGDTHEERRGLAAASHRHSYPHSPPHTHPHTHTNTPILHPQTNTPHSHTHIHTPHTHSPTHIPPHIPHTPTPHTHTDTAPTHILTPSLSPSHTHSHTNTPPNT